MRITKDMKRKFDLIDSLSRLNKPTLQDLSQTTKIPESTIKRQIAILRDEFGMQIEFVRDTKGEPGARGYYLLSHWGILDREAFIQHYMLLVL